MTGPFPPEVAHLPVCPHRALPIPYIAERGADGVGHFTILDDDRAAECLENRLCAMCGRPMGDEVALLGDVASLVPGGFWIEPPVGERCAEIAIAGLCPFVSRQRVPRHDHGGDPSIALVGGGTEHLAEVGRSIAKRPWAMAIARTYTPAYVPSHTGTPVLVYQAARIERVRRYRWGPDGRLAEIIPVPLVRIQPRRRPRSKR